MASHRLQPGGGQRKVTVLTCYNSHREGGFSVCPQTYWLSVSNVFPAPPPTAQTPQPHTCVHTCRHGLLKAKLCFTPSRFLGEPLSGPVSLSRAGGWHSEGSGLRARVPLACSSPSQKACCECQPCAAQTSALEFPHRGKRSRDGFSSGLAEPGIIRSPLLEQPSPQCWVHCRGACARLAEAPRELAPVNPSRRATGVGLLLLSTAGLWVPSCILQS